MGSQEAPKCAGFSARSPVGTDTNAPASPSTGRLLAVDSTGESESYVDNRSEIRHKKSVLSGGNQYLLILQELKGRSFPGKVAGRVQRLKGLI